MANENLSEYINLSSYYHHTIHQLMKKYQEQSAELYKEINIRIEQTLKLEILKGELTQANTDILRMKQRMTPRGTIEFFEERASLLSLSQRNFTRGDKWKHYYRTDYKGLKDMMQTSFPALASMSQVQQEEFVSDLVKESYANTSCFHRSFDIREAVFICESDYAPNQQSFIKIVCNLLPCHYTVN